MKWGILTVFLAWPALAADPVPTALDIHRHCTYEQQAMAGRTLTEGQAITAGFCLGFLRGILLGGAHFQDAAKKSICRPEAVFNGELVEIFMTYVRDHADQLTKPDYVVAAAALREAFPCPGK